MSLHLCVPERFGIATTKGAHEEIGQQGVGVGSILGLSEIASLCRFTELSVIPVGDSQPSGFTVHQVAGQVTPETSPEERRDPTNRRKMILVQIVQNLSHTEYT